MVSATSDETAAFTDAEIVGNILTIFLAGEDTTANTLAWMMHLMAEHPEVQQKMQVEADRVLGAADRAPTFESISELRYMEAVGQETMRLLPVAPLQGAQPTEDTLIGDVWVPQGTPIFLLAGRAARLTASFSDPLAFKPERWLERWPPCQRRPRPTCFLPVRRRAAGLPGASPRHAGNQGGGGDAGTELRSHSCARRAAAGGNLFVHDDAGQPLIAAPARQH